MSASESDATRIVRLAWLRLPPAHRSLLEAVGASQWQIVNGPIGSIADDVAAGDKLLASAPEGISEGIRSAGYGAKNYTHEVVAETYALMMARRIRGYRDKPTWLDDKIYNLLKRVTGWVD